MQIDVEPNKGLIASDVLLKIPDSEVVRLSDFYGKKILLNFFATCCFPCKDEASHLIVAYECNSYEVVYFRVTSQDMPESEHVLAEVHELHFKLALNESRKVGETNKVWVYQRPSIFDLMVLSITLLKV